MSNNDQFDDLDDFDDFDEVSDDLDAVTDVASVDEDWDHLAGNEGASVDGGDGERQGGKAPEKKKSGLFNLLLIAGVALAGGGFIVLKMGDTTAPVPAFEQPDPMMEAQVAEIQNPPPTPPMPAPIQQPEVAPEAALLQSSPAPAPAPEPELPGSGVAPEGADTGLRMPKAEDILLKAAPAGNPSDDGFVPVISASPEVVAPVAMPAVPAPVVSGPDFGPVMEKLDSLSARMESLEAKLEAYRAEKAPAGQVPAVTEDQIKALQRSLATLEQRVEAQASSGRRPAVAADTESVAPPPVAKPKPQILGQSAAGGISAGESGAEAAVPPRPVAPVTTVWVLKGAQPGRAMVAKKGENDLHPVAVGDTLPGIGRITAIEYRDGKWSVIGTLGTIAQ